MANGKEVACSCIAASLAPAWAEATNGSIFVLGGADGRLEAPLAALELHEFRLDARTSLYDVALAELQRQMVEAVRTHAAIVCCAPRRAHFLGGEGGGLLFSPFARA